MGLLSGRQQKTSITAIIDNLIGAHNREDEAANVIDLVELINTREYDGIREAGKALKHGLKDGVYPQRLRTLWLLEMLIDNGGKSMSAMLTETGLGDAVKAQASAPDKRVRNRAVNILHSWSKRSDPRINTLLKETGLKIGNEGRDRDRDRDWDREDYRNRDRDRNDRDYELRRQRSSSFSHQSTHEPRRGRQRSGSELPPSHVRRVRSPSRSPSPINLRGMSITTTIATAHNVATRLEQSIILHEGRITTSRESAGYYRQANQMRKRLINLIHQEDGESAGYLDQLIKANEEVIASLQAYDAAKKGIPVSDSEDELDYVEGPSPVRKRSESPPPQGHRAARPVSVQSEEDDDPFADRNEVNLPPQHTPIW